MGSKDVIRPPHAGAGSRVALSRPPGRCSNRDDLTRGEELCRALGYEPVLAPQRPRAPRLPRRHRRGAARRSQRRAPRSVTRRGLVPPRRLRHDPDSLAGRLRGPARRPKAVIGYSDITALLLAVHREIGLVTFHGPVAHSSLSPFSRWHFDRVLTIRRARRPARARAPPADVLVPRDPRIVTLKCGVAEGPPAGRQPLPAPVPRRHPALPRSRRGHAVHRGRGRGALPGGSDAVPICGWRAMLDKLAGVVVGQFTEMKRAETTARSASTRSWPPTSCRSDSRGLRLPVRPCRRPVDPAGRGAGAARRRRAEKSRSARGRGPSDDSPMSTHGHPNPHEHTIRRRPRADPDRCARPRPRRAPPGGARRPRLQGVQGLGDVPAARGTAGARRASPRSRST